MVKPMKVICPYCCERPGTTADHIIPRSLFPKPIPNGINLPTVIACQECNNEKKSITDTFLRDFLVTQLAALEKPEARNILNGPLARAFDRNQSSFKTTLTDIKPAAAFTYAGKFESLGSDPLPEN